MIHRMSLSSGSVFLLSVEACEQCVTLSSSSLSHVSFKTIHTLSAKITPLQKVRKIYIWGICPLFCLSQRAPVNQTVNAKHTVSCVVRGKSDQVFTSAEVNVMCKAFSIIHCFITYRAKHCVSVSVFYSARL